MRIRILLLLLLALLGTSGLSQDDRSPDQGLLTADNIERRLDDSSSFDSGDIAAASSWVNSVGLVDWLGPLAPVALSPFFGVTCLSGLALWGPEWVTNNALLGASGPLQSELLFFVFLGLTVMTSLPRFTKLSKPLAQAVDRLETYAVIVILLVIKLAASIETSDGTESIAMIQLGVFSATADTLLAIAMIVNVLVINSVKFFCEFMIWLTPIPLIDAAFEVCNKTVCAALMAIYAYSPTVATVINLAILLVAAIVFRWINRRVRFYRTMVLDPILARVWPGYAKPRHPELIVFPQQAIGPFRAKSRLRLRKQDSEDGGLVLEQANWWAPARQYPLRDQPSPQVHGGWIMNRVDVGDNESPSVTCHFSRRYDRATLQALVGSLGMELVIEQSGARDVNGPALGEEFA